MALAVSRARRMERSARAAWFVLGAQLAVFTPWIWHQVYAARPGPPSIAAQVFSWGLLIVMASLAAAFVATLQRWSHREARIVAALQRELDAH